ncbi:tetraspanin-16-like [Engraulis encrasicolus]|uniref:tetraspanin-16-like n=1 Tax=Engraulis encrasicolus TaxID=184585 RepID=UPI002FCEBA95
MALGNMYGFLKYLMMILSAIILVSGIALLGVGIMVNVNGFVKSLGDFSSQLGMISTVLTVAGASLMLLGLIGCYGAWAEKRFFILVFFVVVSLVFLAEIALALIVLMNKNKVEDVIRDASKISLSQHYKGPATKDPISVAWNSLMTKFKCCGVENATVEFVNSKFSNDTGLLYPSVCCVDPNAASCDGTDTSPGVLNTAGCADSLIAVMKSQSIILGSTAAVVCVLELMAMFISIVLYVKLGNNHYSQSSSYYG